ncbi:hypothetical protein EZS27_025348 [termite gut metagenome]|uniref:Uncharacterized protein n=1 Tax=termite gut metagenome TaxID=433724 RepID=A0A5J4QUE8_9ZZZZ
MNTQKTRILSLLEKLEKYNKPKMGDYYNIALECQKNYCIDDAVDMHAFMRNFQEFNGSLQFELDEISDDELGQIEAMLEQTMALLEISTENNNQYQILADWNNFGIYSPQDMFSFLGELNEIYNFEAWQNVINRFSLTKELAREFIKKFVINKSDYPVCNEMYTKGLNNDYRPFIRGPDSLVAKKMNADIKAYVNKLDRDRNIRNQLEDGIAESNNIGGTKWTDKDLEYSLNNCKFRWKLESYNHETQTATVLVFIEDTFNFNEDKDGTRSPFAEALTTIGRAAKMSDYTVEITYRNEYKNITIPLRSEGIDEK